MSVLSRLFRIQPGEGRTVALVVAFMFLSVAGLTIGESGIDALFFDRIGPDSLPVMYLAGGAVGIAGTLALSAALGRFERRRAYVALPLLVAAVVAVERAVVTAGPTWIYPAMWLTVTVAYWWRPCTYGGPPDWSPTRAAPSGCSRCLGREASWARLSEGW